MRLISAAACAISTFIPYAANAANLVSNADFDVDTTGWSPAFPVMSIVRDGSLNAVSGTGQGAAVVTNGGGAGFSSGVDYCVSAGIVPGGVYDLGAWILVPSGQVGTGDASVGLYFYNAAGCTGTAVGAGSTGIALSFDTWELKVGTSTAPASAVSALVRLRVYSADPTPFSAAYDGARFGLTPTTPVQLQGFNVN